MTTTLKKNNNFFIFNFEERGVQWHLPPGERRTILYTAKQVDPNIYTMF